MSWAKIIASDQFKTAVSVSRVALMPLLSAAVGGLVWLLVSVGANREFSEARAKDNETFQAAMIEFKRESVASDRVQASDIAGIKTDLAVAKAILEEMRRQGVPATGFRLP